MPALFFAITIQSRSGRAMEPRPVHACHGSFIQPFERWSLVPKGATAPMDADQQQHDHSLRDQLEDNADWSQSAKIVKWNRALGDSTYTTLNAGSVCPGLSNVGVIGASITGNRITVTQDGVTIATASDDTFTSESPGIGLARPARYGQYVRLHKLRHERLMIYTLASVTVGVHPSS